MAEAPDTSDKRLEELEEEITCAVCQSHYLQAKLLPCNHYYCRACIEELAKRSRGRPFCLPRVSQGGHSTPRRRGGAAGRVLRGANKRSVLQNGEGGREDGSGVRAVRESKVSSVLSSVHGIVSQSHYLSAASLKGVTILTIYF